MLSGKRSDRQVPPPPQNWLSRTKRATGSLWYTSFQSLPTSTASLLAITAIGFLNHG